MTNEGNTFSQQFAQFVWELRVKLGQQKGSDKEISQEELAQLIGVDRRTIIRWEQGLKSKITLNELLSLARVAGVPYFQLIHEFFPEFDQDQQVPSLILISQKLRVKPLAAWPTTNEFVRTAVFDALQAREAYVKGDLRKSARIFCYAVDAAKMARYPLLQAYIMLYLGNVYELLGGVALIDAERTFDEARKIADQERRNAIRGKDAELEFVAGRIDALAQLRRAWVLWARNEYRAALATATNLQALFTTYGLFRWRSYLYELKARCHVGLNELNLAVERITEAVAFIYMLVEPTFTKYDFFLEPGMSYNWPRDQIWTAAADIFAASNDETRAIDALKQVVVPLTAGSTLSLHAPFLPLFQKRLKQEVAIGTLSSEHDPKLDTSYTMWDEQLEQGGDTHIRARVSYSAAEMEQAAGNLVGAIALYKKAARLANESGAAAVEAHGIISCALSYIQLRDRNAAKAELEKVSTKISHLDDAWVRQRYQQALEAIAQFP